MSHETIMLALLAGGTFLLAGFVKGVVGLGLPTVAMGLLSLALPPPQAAALLVVPSLVTNLWQLAAGPSFAALLTRLWPMMAGVTGGTLVGAILLGGLQARWAGNALGGMLVLYALLGLASSCFSAARFSIFRFRVTATAEPWLAPLTGVATGLVTALTGVFILPAVPYLQALGLEKDDLVQALGLSFTVSTLALAAGLAGTGTFAAGDAAASLLALVPALLGMAAGQWARRRMRPELFRTCFFAGLLLLGAHLVLNG